MVCQRCKQRPATVQITQVINGHKSEMYLCEYCAGTRQDLVINLPFNMPSFNMPFNISNLLSSIMENINNISPLPVQKEFLQCDTCGMTFEEFTQYGKFGCANCYGVFGSKLIPVFRRLHGNTKHTGKVPARIGKEIRSVKEISNLKMMLEEAIKREEYEKAAQIRDKIKALEAEQKQNRGK